MRGMPGSNTITSYKKKGKYCSQVYKINTQINKCTAKGTFKEPDFKRNLSKLKWLPVESNLDEKESK